MVNRLADLVCSIADENQGIVCNWVKFQIDYPFRIDNNITRRAVLPGHSTKGVGVLYINQVELVNRLAPFRQSSQVSHEVGFLELRSQALYDYFAIKGGAIIDREERNFT
jgi:hypothetical protein